MDRIAKNSTYELRDSNPVKEGLLQLSQHECRESSTLPHAMETKALCTEMHFATFWGS